MIPLIDIHTHRKYSSTDIIFIRQAYHCMDISSIERLDYPLSMGIHPWFVNVKEKFEWSQIPNTMVKMIGEAGYDKIYNPNSLSEQKTAFEFQVKIAKEFNLPLILHVVKAEELIWPYLQDKSQVWIIHNYKHSAAMNRLIMETENVYASLGSNFRRKPSNYQDLPISKIFVETDDSNLALYDLYHEVMTVYEMQFDFIKSEIFNNYKKIFYK